MLLMLSHLLHGTTMGWCVYCWIDMRCRSGKSPKAADKRQ
jgi:hypothetical protein